MLSFGIISSQTSGAASWSTFTPTGVDYYSVAFGGGTAVFARLGTATGYSTTPTTAITAGGASSATGRVSYLGGRFYRVNPDTTSTGGTEIISYSNNGTSWLDARNNTISEVQISTIAYNGSVFMAPRFNDNDVFTSTNGTAFTLQSSVLATGDWRFSSWNSSVFGVYSLGGTSYYTSTDGTTWTARTLPSGPRSEVVADSSGLVGYFGASGVFYTSTDGTAFSVAGTAPASLGGGGFNEVVRLAYGGGAWLVADNIGGTVQTYYSQNNGASWATATFATAETAADGSFNLAYDSSTFYLVADAGSTTRVHTLSI